MAYKIPPDITITTTQYDVLVGDTGNAIASVGPGSSGQVLKSGGAAANPAYTTATFPSTATGTGKILRADGTNWAATTATFPDTAGTSGNVLTSDGSNWSSSAPPTGLGYALTMINRALASPADGATYFMSHGGFIVPTASGGSRSRLYIPQAGTVTKVYGSITVTGTLGSTETGTLSLRLNNTTDTTITSTLQLSAADNTFNATVSISVVAGDYLEFKFDSPTWASNPTNVSFSGSMYIE